MYRFIDQEYAILSKPLTRAEVIRGMDDEGYIDGVIEISLASIIDSGYENFLDLISEKLIGNVCLSNINYKIVGCGDSDAVLILVSGHSDEYADVPGDIPEDVIIALPAKFAFTSKQNCLAKGIIYQAERVNEHGDYHVSWGWNADEERGISKFKVNGEDYIENEVKYNVSSGQWIIKNPDCC